MTDTDNIYDQILEECMRTQGDQGDNLSNICIQRIAELSDVDKRRLYAQLCGSTNLSRNYPGGCMRICGLYNVVAGDCRNHLRTRCRNVRYDQLEDHPECSCFLSGAQYREYLDSENARHIYSDNPEEQQYISMLLQNSVNEPQCFHPKCTSQDEFMIPHPPNGCADHLVCIQNLDLNVGNPNDNDINIVQECLLDRLDLAPSTPGSPGSPSTPSDPGTPGTPSDPPSTPGSPSTPGGQKLGDNEKKVVSIVIPVVGIIVLIVIILVIILIVRTYSNRSS